MVIKKAIEISSRPNKVSEIYYEYKTNIFELYTTLNQNCVILSNKSHMHYLIRLNVEKLYDYQKRVDEVDDTEYYKSFALTTLENTIALSHDKVFAPEDPDLELYFENIDSFQKITVIAWIFDDDFAEFLENLSYFQPTVESTTSTDYITSAADVISIRKQYLLLGSQLESIHTIYSKKNINFFDIILNSYMRNIILHNNKLIISTIALIKLSTLYYKTMIIDLTIINDNHVFIFRNKNTFISLITNCFLDVSIIYPNLKWTQRELAEKKAVMCIGAKDNRTILAPYYNMPKNVRIVSKKKSSK